MKYSIIIPTYNHCNDLLRPCLESIKKYTDLFDVEVIVVANGCTDNTREYVESLGHPIKLVWFDKPLGYAGANNQGLKIAKGDKIVLLNNDTVLLEQPKNSWLTLLDANFNNADCGISSVNNLYSAITQRYFAVFFCVMIKKAVFDKIGLLNEEYGTGSSEDIEFCYLAEQSGFNIYKVGTSNYAEEYKTYTGNFPIYHIGEGTVHDKSLVPTWNDIFFQNELKLAKKYNTKWYEENVNRYNTSIKIAVITPVYNDILHIENAITTVRKQTVGNIKHYIYNDCSTDGTAQLLDNYRHDNGIFIDTGTTNQGQSAARNKLIAQALRDGCNVIAFLDSDDTWTSTHLETTIKYLDNADVIYSTPLFGFDNGVTAAPFNIPVPHTFIGKQLQHNNFIWISSVVANAQCFVSNTFDSSLDSIEDWDMWYRLHEQNFRFHKASDTTCSYLVRSTGQAAQGSIKRHSFERKHKVLPTLKLHLACGHDYQPDYINIDLYPLPDAKVDAIFNIKELPYDDNSVDEIRALHIIEHFDFFEGQEVLKEWYRVLKPGGRLLMETPDFLATCDAFVKGSEEFRILLYGHFFAHPWIPGQTHKFLFTESQLTSQLSWTGFKNTKRLAPISNYVRPDTYKLFLTTESFK